MHEFLVDALDLFEPEENPNGKMRIFGIGTRVRVPTGQIGHVVGIGRRTLKVKLPTLQRSPTRSYQSRLLEIVETQSGYCAIDACQQ